MADTPATASPARENRRVKGRKRESYCSGCVNMVDTPRVAGSLVCGGESRLSHFSVGGTAVSA